MPHPGRLKSIQLSNDSGLFPVSPCWQSSPADPCRVSRLLSDALPTLRSASASSRLHGGLAQALQLLAPALHLLAPALQLLAPVLQLLAPALLLLAPALALQLLAPGVLQLVWLL